MKSPEESPKSEISITIHDLFPNLHDRVNILALVGILQLHFHRFFEQFRENNPDAKSSLHKRVSEYIDANLEIFTRLFGTNGMDKMTSAGNFYQAIASLLLKPAEWPNPMQHFFMKYIKPRIDFEEQFFIRNGIEPDEKSQQQSQDTIRSPQALKKTLKILKSKIPRIGKGAEHYKMLKNLAGDDESEKNLDWMLIKTAWEFYEIPTGGFKPEHMPDTNVIEKLLETFKKIPVLCRILG